MAYSQLNPVWKQYDAPYYDDYQYFSNFKEFELQKSESILSNSNRLGIFVDDKLVGTVSRYWVCKQTRWMELGIGIYDKKFWNTGIGKVAMLQWIDRTFQDYLELEHLGLTTWSGNH
ncbi:acetyltransferase [Streptococcus pneumoniae]|nr:acetyltransferase [Streptococcus pneumoniae]VME55676.1 acetyltransferase [Streptococcus pneumoniae]VNL06403.1 acetyltransferase [Streptococcus pneumoniae]